MTLLSEVDDLANTLLDYMKLNMPVKKSDVVVGMGTLDTRVAERASQLFLEGYADKIIFTGGFGRITKDRQSQTEAELFRDVAVGMGVPFDKISIEPTASNTGENIIKTKNLIESMRHEVSSIIFVTKPYMERRVRATFNKQWTGNRPEMIVTSPQITYEQHYNGIIPKELFLNVLVSDVQRMRLYATKGYQTEENIPANVWKAYERLVELGFDKQLAG